LRFRVPNFVDTSTLVEITITTKHSEVYIHWVCRKTNPKISSLDDKKDTSKIIFYVCQVIDKINIWVGKRPTNDKSKSTIISNANSTAIGTTGPVQ
jgi:hypothetical protein